MSRATNYLLGTVRGTKRQHLPRCVLLCQYSNWSRRRSLLVSASDGAALDVILDFLEVKGQVKMKERILLGIGLAGCFAGGLPALALPFNPDPASFAAYLNAKQGWSDGKKRYFSNFHNCRQVGDYNMYVCKAGYVKIVSPMGSIFCEMQPNEPIAKNVITWANGKADVGPDYPCQQR